MIHKRPIFILLGLFIGFLAMPLFAVAQDTPPTPQFLYRSDNHLILLDGYTGKSTTLPIDVTERDRFVWSPNGQFLLARLDQGEKNGYCLNLYNVDKQKWIHDAPISCAVQDAIFSDDSERIFYSTDDTINVVLWMYSFNDEISHEVYRTTTEDAAFPTGISSMKWSPTGSYLTFKDYKWIMGGTLNSFVVMNVKSEKYFTLNAPNLYYADYYPVWSASDSWFLITLKEEYVTSGASPETNHLGDVYLVNSETGKQYRLTYTPAESEVDVHWTDDGMIAFTEVSEEKFSYTIDEAMKIEAVPPDKIITPEPVDYGDTQFVSYDMVSPDPNIGAWIKQTEQPDNTYSFELVIGDLPKASSEGKFSTPISDPDKTGTILIGWRPSNYPYPQPPSPS